MAVVHESAYGHGAPGHSMVDPSGMYGMSAGAQSYQPQSYYGQMGGGYGGYAYPQPSMSPDGMAAMGMEGYAPTNIGMDPQTMNGTGQYSFIMPNGGAMAVGDQGDTSMQTFQQSFGGNFPFYDTNVYGNGGGMPQGFMQGYENFPNGEPRKAVKKQPVKESATKRNSKVKKLFPCC